jgi:hypothetical protein
LLRIRFDGEIVILNASCLTLEHQDVNQWLSCLVFFANVKVLKGQVKKFQAPPLKQVFISQASDR